MCLFQRRPSSCMHHVYSWTPYPFLILLAPLAEKPLIPSPAYILGFIFKTCDFPEDDTRHIRLPLLRITIQRRRKRELRGRERKTLRSGTESKQAVIVFTTSSSSTLPSLPRTNSLGATSRPGENSHTWNTILSELCACALHVRYPPNFVRKKNTMWVKFCDGRSPRTYPYVSEISSDIGAIRIVTRHPTTTRFINALPRSRDNSPEASLGYM